MKFKMLDVIVHKENVSEDSTAIIWTIDEKEKHYGVFWPFYGDMNVHFQTFEFLEHNYELKNENQI